MSDEPHPESYCHRCNGRNVSWWAPSPLWNAVMRGNDINGPWQYNEIICLLCFIEIATEQGAASGWRLSATTVNVELKTVTPSGRVWDEETQLWQEPEVLAERASAVESLRTQLAEARAELDHWRSGRRTKGLPTIQAVPDALHYAAELVRAQGTEGGEDHDRLLVEAGMRLKAIHDAATARAEGIREGRRQAVAVLDKVRSTSTPLPACAHPAAVSAKSLTPTTAS